ncbi:helix-turn-helix transcriptional regulator [Pigmentiphaga sp.]|uniref:helix-turn-helix domain-containing protein n=1 Tax=Pigmentiphaga sp. TaxID=1977564 RepID=UPI0025E259B4|nr:helix-turn-helix transcriptional regulator [Pigmentiphaga sp.]
MAARLDVRQPTCANMEGPDARPRQATLVHIAQALGISLDQLDDRMAGQHTSPSAVPMQRLPTPVPRDPTPPASSATTPRT